MHDMTLVSFGLFRKNLGNLREFFGQMHGSPPPWQKIARTPMTINYTLKAVKRTKCIANEIHTYLHVKYTEIAALEKAVDLGKRILEHSMACRSMMCI